MINLFCFTLNHLQRKRKIDELKGQLEESERKRASTEAQLQEAKIGKEDSVSQVTMVTEIQYTSPSPKLLHPVISAP